ncbi:MAG TPA: nitrate reductase formation protein NapD [Acidobacteria bacterium]|nr:nitrate reductase formation protein NapD [Acidobacteriota bacterium]
MWNPRTLLADERANSGSGFTCSGIVVTVRPAEMDRVRRSLEELEGVRVHQEDAASGRLVVTQTGGSDREQAEGLRRIQKVPGVLTADLVYYHRGEPDDDSELAQEREKRHG